jgi:predicted nucleic acid-binding Zn ribbon protein
VPIYPFECSRCGKEKEILWPIKDYDSLPVPRHCGRKMEQVLQTSCIVHQRIIGRDTGVYDLDYGKRATEDLTYKAKQERLKKDGRFYDPFDHAPPSPPPSQEVIDAFR